MDINICPACGAVYKPRSKDCTRCGAVQSKFASTTVSTMASTVAPMVVSVAPDRLILERIVTGRQLNALVPATYYGADAYATDDFTSEFFDAYGSNGGSATTGSGDNVAPELVHPPGSRPSNRMTPPPPPPPPPPLLLA
ncbi:MAG TPA: hypothetical protein PKA48_12305, partial [Candidatus Obscuribacter sp.]|nr:hypothetical protein [Candidatus Obscuribacter sp.]